MFLDEKKLMTKKPPHLRVSAGGDRCEGCGNYSLKSGSAWRGDGWCYRHEAPVREDFLCADYSPGDSDQR